MPPIVTTASPRPALQASNSGIQLTASGDRVIPSSRRADGSTRREIRIRPGYLPPEDVEVYRNRTAEAFRNRGSARGGIPGAEVVGSEKTGNNGIANDEDDQRKKTPKTAKRREARKRNKEKEQNDKMHEILDATNPSEEVKVELEVVAATATTDQNIDVSAVERERKIRNLKKKLKQARELKSKKDKGEDLLPDQLSKVIRINQLILDLKELGVVVQQEQTNGESQDIEEK